MKVLCLDASRRFGRKVSETRATVVFLLRNVFCFDEDETIQLYVASGHARLVQGDAVVDADVQKAWTASSEGFEHGFADVVVSSLGALAKFNLIGGSIIDPPDLCTRALLALLTCFPRDVSAQPLPQPKLILISSVGMGKRAHAALPVAMKHLYAYLLRSPFKDKLGMERVAHCAARGWVWPEADGEPRTLPARWKARLDGERAEGEGFLTDLVIVRATIFTDGACKADKKGVRAYRVQDKEIPGGYTISRRTLLTLWSRNVYPSGRSGTGSVSGSRIEGC